MRSDLLTRKEEVEEVEEVEGVELKLEVEMERTSLKADSRWKKWEVEDLKKL